MQIRLIIFLSCFSFPLCAQNLVANGSMEDENICTEYIKNCAPEGWILSSLQSHFYFDDPPNAYHGQHFIGLTAGWNRGYGSRNFIRSPLLCGLRKDAAYRIEFYIRTGMASLDSAGVMFSADDLLYRKRGLANVKPQLWFTDHIAASTNVGWKKFSAVYKAAGDEAFINIALFKTTPAERMSRSATNPEYYFFVDNVSIIPLDPNEKLCVDAKNIEAEIYEADERHTLLEKQVYARQRKQPMQIQLLKTIVQKIDTLILPDVLFATNSFELKKTAMALLDSFALEINKARPDSIVIEGHTDNQGSKSLNEQLSMNRATSVATQLGKVIIHKELKVYKKRWGG